MRAHRSVPGVSLCCIVTAVLAVAVRATRATMTATAVIAAAGDRAGAAPTMKLGLLLQQLLDGTNTSTLVPDTYYAVGPSAANAVVTLGYAIAVTNGTTGRFSVQLMSDADYAKFRAGQSYQYYSAYSFTDVTTAAYASQSFTSPAALYLVLMASPFPTASVTVTYNIGFFQGRCPVSGGCGNGGICTTSGCSCAAGWTGTTCQTRVCTPACVHGTCSSTDGTCACDNGWTGPTCTVFTCSPPCRNGGTCVGPSQCACTPEWLGATCEDPTPGTLTIQSGSTLTNTPCAATNVTAGGVLVDTPIVLYNLESQTPSTSGAHMAYLYLRDSGVLQLTCVNRCTGAGVSYATAIPVTAGQISTDWQVVYQTSSTAPPVSMCSQTVIRGVPSSPNGGGGSGSDDDDWRRDPTTVYVLLGISGVALLLCGWWYHSYRVAVNVLARRQQTPPLLATVITHTPSSMSHNHAAPAPYPLGGRQLYAAPGAQVEGAPHSNGGYGALP